ncbi:hypothetical protein FEQ05_03417 [Burkholderia pseudomultivorans]|uniref:Transposase n=1 Tax=Burkholderia pseudomultivorans TaxID=1207504 RepID=A0ABU2E5Y9_9BURK|nr:hypothetical protein [Burkholderia pseudomultivorans]MDR8737760.1 hypothetical protein [Burkholderia pseudomultivorans]MDR8743966.1 hypothetical protein [Burkholderia pseudomultivorans]MDR8755291.1 hypothetical protein [Burkholderia pseudomultivorans]MDR8780416.1 hypothetical protein [Burkholderia pseudomultivorans]
MFDSDLETVNFPLNVFIPEGAIEWQIFGLFLRNMAL